MISIFETDPSAVAQSIEFSWGHEAASRYRAYKADPQAFFESTPKKAEVRQVVGRDESLIEAALELKGTTPSLTQICLHSGKSSAYHRVLSYEFRAELMALAESPYKVPSRETKYVIMKREKWARVLESAKTLAPTAKTLNLRVLAKHAKVSPSYLSIIDNRGLKDQVEAIYGMKCRPNYRTGRPSK